MTDHGIEFPVFRLHVVPAILALASPSWQRDVWLRPEEFEDLDYVVTVLFDDFCKRRRSRAVAGQEPADRGGSRAHEKAG